MDTAGQIPLATAIRALRSEIVSAVAEGASEAVQFELDTIELEFQVQVARERGADGSVGFWVLSVGAKGSQTSQEGHTVRVSIKPVSSATAGKAGPVIVGSDRDRRPD